MSDIVIDLGPHEAVAFWDDTEDPAEIQYSDGDDFYVLRCELGRIKVMGAVLVDIEEALAISNGTAIKWYNSGGAKIACLRLTTADVFNVGNHDAVEGNIAISFDVQGIQNAMRITTTEVWHKLPDQYLDGSNNLRWELGLDPADNGFYLDAYDASEVFIDRPIDIPNTGSAVISRNTLFRGDYIRVGSNDQCLIYAWSTASMWIRHQPTSGQSIIDIDPLPVSGASSYGYIRGFRTTNTIAAKWFQLFKGDGSGTGMVSFRCGTSPLYEFKNSAGTTIWSLDNNGDMDVSGDISGGTLTLDGVSPQLVIKPAVDGAAFIYLDTLDTDLYNRGVSFRHNSITRIALQVDTSNVFNILTNDSSGVYIDTPLSIVPTAGAFMYIRRPIRMDNNEAIAYRNAAGSADRNTLYRDVLNGTELRGNTLYFYVADESSAVLAADCAVTKDWHFYNDALIDGILSLGSEPWEANQATGRLKNYSMDHYDTEVWYDSFLGISIDVRYTQATVSGGSITLTARVNGWLYITATGSGSAYLVIGSNGYRLFSQSWDPTFETYVEMGLADGDSYFGFANDEKIHTSTRGIYFHNDAGVLYSKTVASGGTTSNNLGSWTSGLKQLRIEVVSGTAYFYVNDSLAATHSTNVPTEDLSVSVGCNALSVSEESEIEVDFWKVTQTRGDT